MTKALRQAIMRRSTLKTKYLKTKTEENLKAFKNRRTIPTDWQKGKELSILQIWI